MKELSEEQKKIFESVKQKTHARCNQMVEDFVASYEPKSEEKNCIRGCVETHVRMVGGMITQTQHMFADHGFYPYDEVDKVLDFFKKINQESRMANQRVENFANIKGEG